MSLELSPSSTSPTPVRKYPTRQRMPSLKSLESIPDCPPSVSRFLGAVDQAPDAGPSGPDAFRGMPTLVAESESETTASDESLTPPSSPGSSSPSPVAHTNALPSAVDELPVSQRPGPSLRLSACARTSSSSPLSKAQKLGGLSWSSASGPSARSASLPCPGMRCVHSCH